MESLTFCRSNSFNFISKSLLFFFFLLLCRINQRSETKSIKRLKTQPKATKSSEESGKEASEFILNSKVEPSGKLDGEDERIVDIEIGKKIEEEGVAILVRGLKGASDKEGEEVEFSWVNRFCTRRVEVVVEEVVVVRRGNASDPPP